MNSLRVSPQENGVLPQEGPSPKTTNIFLAFLIITGLVIRFSLFHLHQIIEGDGVHYAALARIISHEGSLIGVSDNYWSNLWPAVIAFFDRFLFHNIDLAGRTASAVFGSLTVIPVYLLGREIYDKRTSLLAAALVTGHPFLIRFSVLLFSESFFTFILAFSLWLGIRLVKIPDRRARWLLLGIVIGLGLLTRPEIQALAVFFPIAALVRGLYLKMPQSRIFAGITIFGLVVTSFLSLRATLIWKATGAWQFGFGTKAAINLRMGDKIYVASERSRFLNKLEGGKFVNRRAAGEKTLSFLWKNRGELAGRARSNLKKIGDSYYQVLPSGKGHPALVIVSALFAALGLVSSLVQRRSRLFSILLLILFFFYSAPWLFLFVLPRFVVPLIPIVILFTACGLWILERSLYTLSRSRTRAPAWPVLSLALALAFISSGVRWARHTRESTPIVQKEAGQYLRANFPQQTRILTQGPHIPYYFYEGNPNVLSRQSIPWASYEEVLKYARRHRIDLLVLPEWSLKAGDYPIKDIFSEKAPPKGVSLITVIGEKAPFRIWIYKVERRAGPKKKKSEDKIPRASLPI